MSVNVLPNETLHQIFGYLRGGEVLECRKVCRRWEEAVDSLGDVIWKQLCAKEHISEVYESAYRKASLSWRELYASLSRWSDIATADIKIHNIPDRNAGYFQTLDDGILAVSCSMRPHTSARRRDETKCDTIVYYDLETLSERRRESFDFLFISFEENEYFYIFELKGQHSKENYVRVTLKSNRKYIDFRRDVHGTWNWVLHENMVYLQCYDLGHHFCRVKLVKENNVDTLETENIQYAECYCRIRAVVNVNSEQTNIFALEGRVHRSAQIYSLTGKKLKLLCLVNTRDNKCQQIIKSHGFNLRCLPIFELVSRYFFADDDTKILFYHCAKTVMIYMKEHCRIDIYYIPRDSPYEISGKLNLEGAKPTKSINLCIKQSKDDNEFDLKQIDVVEALNAHRIIVSFRSKSLVIELNHKSSDKTATLDEDVDFYETIFNNQNRLIYSSFEYYKSAHTNYAIDPEDPAQYVYDSDFD